MNGSGGMHLSRTFGEVYTGARATPTLVGRTEILDQIYQTFHPPPGPSAITYIIGKGGTGKTRLIQHILTDVADNPELIVARELIDLYHTRNRTVGGLIESILAVVEPLDDFLKYRPAHTRIDEQIIDLSRAEQEGLTAAEIIGQRQELTDILIELINEFTVEKRLVLALDTAERLLIAEDEAQQKLGLAAQRPEILGWLLESLLPNLNNTMLIIAGRPELNLTKDLQKITSEKGHQFVPVQLEGLNEAESMAYIEAVIQKAKESNNPVEQEAAQALQNWSTLDRQIIFYSLHDGGDVPRIRPILLALTIDHLVIAGQPVPVLNRTLEEAQALTQTERRDLEKQLGAALVQMLHEHQRPADQALLTLAWLRKGAEKELLRKLTGLSETEINEATSQLKELSFVKVRPADERLFLHDEMYDLLQSYILEDTAPDAIDDNYKIIDNYYNAQIQKYREEIDQLYRPQSDAFESTLPEPALVRQTRARLQDAFVEDLYYHLQADAQRAFQIYFIYAEEAIGGNDDILSILLRSELFSYLKEQKEKNPNLLGSILPEKDVVADSAVRWIARTWGRDEFDDALDLAERLTTEQQELIAQGGEVAHAHLMTWHGYLLTYASDYVEAEPLLQKAIAYLSGLQTHTPQTAGILARAYNALGYLYRVQDKFRSAIPPFQQAINLWQRIGLDVERANALNNLSYALSRLGRYHEALPNVLEGLHLQEFLATRVPVGLSMNTKALIEIGQYDLNGARRDAQRAYEIFKGVKSRRGEGLALNALAEAKRLLSTTITYIQENRSAQFLEEAVEHAGQAVEIFKKLGESSRLIEAYHKQANIYRDWAKLRHQYPTMISQGEAKHQKYSVKWLVENSRRSYQQAIKLAQEEDNPSQEIDVQVDLAHLEYQTQIELADVYGEKSEQAVEAPLLTLFGKSIPKKYEQPPTPGSPHKDKEWYLVQAGNVALLQGHIDFQYWHRHQKKDSIGRLQNAFEHYGKALAYFKFFSEPIFFEKRQAMDQIHAHLSQIDNKHYTQMYTWLDEFDAKYWLNAQQRSAMRSFFERRFGQVTEEIQIEF